MKLRTLLVLTAMTATMSLATGCDNNKAGDPPGETPKVGGHEHGGKHSGAVATVEIEGRTVLVELGSELEAGKPYPHCHVTITGDPVDAMRVWIGPASGEGALKNLVARLADHPNVDLKAPADLEGAVLGIEIDVDGETFTASAAFDDGDHADADGHDHNGHGHEEGDGHGHDDDGDEGHSHPEGDHDDHDH